MIDYRLLGPFEVSLDGHALDVGGLKQRALLAILLLHAKQAVHRDVLIDQLWGERPPAGADHAVGVYIWRLRKTLDPVAGSPCVLTRAGGYLLQVTPEQVDMARFGRLAEDGHRSLAAGDASRAAGQLREAVALWRGSPLADFKDEPFAQAEITRRRSCAPTLWRTGSRRIWRSASTHVWSANWRPATRSQSAVTSACNRGGGAELQAKQQPRRQHRGRREYLARAANGRRAIILTGRGMSPMSNEIHLAGRWTDGSPRSAAISVTLTIDMSAWGRPTAHGSVLDGSTISVTFPDDATYTGTLLPPDMIRWSNGSIWQRADLGKGEGGD